MKINEILDPSQFSWYKKTEPKQPDTGKFDPSQFPWYKEKASPEAEIAPDSSAQYDVSKGGLTGLMKHHNYVLRNHNPNAWWTHQYQLPGKSHMVNYNTQRNEFQHHHGEGETTGQGLGLLQKSLIRHKI